RALAACPDEAKKRDAELTELLNWLPGSYDNAAQANADPQAGVQPPHAHVALTIVKVYTPRLGHHVLYAQENAPDDPRRVMSERLFSFSNDEKRGIIESVYTFAEPLRWRDGQEHLELFTSVVTEDVRTIPGCELLWKKVGERFTAAPERVHCPDPGAAAVTAELSAESLELAGYRFRKSR
ncbi:MAG TPA: chromophore lyase CpcT/CpeT, partial [Candidatus Dormibacteraeota bacterium]|nr:chromophore lyase CpcT/CpeT [Candidatus Dormibacteraeota bacterium]